MGIKKHTAGFLITVLAALLIHGGLHGQDTTVVDGNEYLIHKVIKGDTPYGIAKRYHISFEEITKENPFLKDGLKVGQELRIPIHKNALQINDNDGVAFIIHTVKKKETLYALSKRYNISTAEILRFNPVVKSGLRTGQRLKIPLKSNTEKPHSAPSDSTSVQIIETSDMLAQSDTAIFKEVYDIALLLPFYCAVNDSMRSHRHMGRKKGVYPRSLIAIRFYEGVLLALDSLKKTGVSARLYVYDTTTDSAAVRSILSKDEMQSMDLIIGPLFRKNFTPVAAFAKAHRIPIVSPVPQSNRILLGNSWVSKVAPSVSMQMQEVGRYIAGNFSNEKLTIIRTAAKGDVNLFDRCKSACNKYLAELENRAQDSLLEISMSSPSEHRIREMLDQDKVNVIVLPSSNQVYVSDFLTKLHKQKKEHRIIVFGTADWFGFESLDVDYLHGLHIHLPATFHLDYSSPGMMKMLRVFRERF
ncbi:MAG: LysM peptidoglycan-binding domain-containing protein, partial [Flavobacteriales bacterium]